jgi:hypothetical protein
MRPTIFGFAILLLASMARAGDEGFVPLFNGRDLGGWVNVNVAPDTFTVRDGLLVCSGKPIGELRTERMYENFILELEYKHLVPGGNAGVFVWSDALTARGQPFIRAIEVQVLDGRNSETHTSHGDIFPIHGAKMTPDRPHPRGGSRCLPSERRARPAGEWNHYRITCRDGAIKLAVNGKEVSGGTECLPRKGYICLESEGGVVHWRNLRIRELPTTDPEPDEIAKADRGFRSLYNGVDFTGWKHTEEHAGHWKVRDWIIDYDGKGKSLWTAEEFGDFELIVDWRFTRKPAPRLRPVILPSGDYATDEDGSRKQEEVLDAGDSGILLRGSGRGQVNIWCWPAGSGELWSVRNDARLPAALRAAAVPRMRADRQPGQWNRFHITLKGDRVTVILNGETVIEEARIPDLKPEGAIGLQHHGDPIQFANVFVREL